MFDYNLRADCHWRTLAPPYDNSANAARVTVQALSAVQALMLAVVALKQPIIECLTLCVSRGMNGGNNP